jgi:hypothetical protein
MFCVCTVWVQREKSMMSLVLLTDAAANSCAGLLDQTLNDTRFTANTVGASAKLV